MLVSFIDVRVLALKSSVYPKPVFWLFVDESA